MVQQIQPKPVITKPVVAKPVTTQSGVQPVEEGSIWTKWWVWVIIAVVIIGIGIGAYSLLS